MQQKKRLQDNINHFKLNNFFNDIYPSVVNAQAKGKIINKILKEKKIPKIKALMVGDSFRYDFLSAKKVGIDAFFIKNNYSKIPKVQINKKYYIKNLKDILKSIN